MIDNQPTWTADIINVSYVPQFLTVEIEGFDSLYAYGMCSWYADVSAGTSPFDYDWYALNPDLEDPEWESMPSYYEDDNDIEFELDDLNEEFDWELEPGDYFLLKVIVEDDEEETEIDSIEVGISSQPSPKRAAKQLPKDFKLEQNYPNPFNPVTTINFKLPKASNVTLVIYNIQGREVARLVDGYMQAGYRSITWDASTVSSGIYIYRLQAGEFSDTKRMLLIK